METEAVTWLRFASGLAPGEWIDRENDEDGVLVYAPRDLAWWLGEALWEVETCGVIRPVVDGARAEAVRLVRRVDAWADVGARLVPLALREGHAVIPREHARLRAWAEAGATTPVLAAYYWAMAAALASPAPQRAAFEEARAAQSRWIASELGYRESM